MNDEPKMSYAIRQRIFRLRCKSKSGGGLTESEQQEISEAFKRYPEQYSAMEPEVFEATKPFGAL